MGIARMWVWKLTKEEPVWKLLEPLDGSKGRYFCTSWCTYRYLYYSQYFHPDLLGTCLICLEFRMPSLFCCAIIFVVPYFGKWSTTKDGDTWSCSQAPTRAQQPWKVEMRSWWTKTRPWCWCESYLQTERYTDTSYMFAYIHTFYMHTFLKLKIGVWNHFVLITSL